MLEALGLPTPSWLPEIALKADFGDFYMAYGGLVLVFNTIER